MERQYYLRDRKGKPIVTVVLIKNENTTVRGMAICSKSDNPVKQHGFQRAHDRAASAVLTEKCSDPIRSPRAWDIIRTVKDDLPSLWKSEFNPKLSEFERKILKETP